MTSLRNIVEQNDTVLGKAFDGTIQILIVISVVAFSIETLPGLSDRALMVLEAAEATIVLIFTAEYLLRLYFSKRKWAFIFSFYGIIDLLAILPFYLAVGLDLRSLRILRLARLAVILKLVRYSQAARSLQMAFKLVKDEVMVFALFSFALIYLSAVGIYFCERAAQPDVFQSVFEGSWWTVVTLTTVGYGDAVPITAGGKIFTFLF